MIDICADPDETDQRRMALSYAMTLHQYTLPDGDIDPILATANAIWRWLTAPVVLIVRANRVTDQNTGQLTGNPGSRGTSMVAMKDSEKFELSVTAEDAKGQVTAPPKDVTYSPADTNVISISAPDTNGAVWAVAGNPGSTVITATWPDSPTGPINGTLAVDVTVGDATSLVVNAATPVPQAA